MLHRVKGVSTAWRYSNTELYTGFSKPEGMTYREYMKKIVSTYPDVKYRNTVKYRISKLIQQHFKKTADAIPDEDAHPLTGASYKFMCLVAKSGDFKRRKTAVMLNQGQRTLKKMGISLDEAERQYSR